MTNEPLPTASAIDWKNLFVSFNGRIRRQHFWIGVVICIVASIVGGLLPDIIGYVVSLALLWPYAALFIKRGHDFGKPTTFSYIPVGLFVVSTALTLVYNFTTAAATQAALASGDPNAILAAAAPGMGLLGIAGLVGLVGLGFLIWYGVADSQRGSNAYGPNPKGEN